MLLSGLTRFFFADNYHVLITLIKGEKKMIKTIHVCDLCKKESAQVTQFHANAISNKNKTLNYAHSDKVNFPPQWVKVGVNAICGDCFDSVRSIN